MKPLLNIKCRATLNSNCRIRWLGLNWKGNEIRQ